MTKSTLLVQFKRLLMSCLGPGEGGGLALLRAPKCLNPASTPLWWWDGLTTDERRSANTTSRSRLTTVHVPDGEYRPGSCQVVGVVNSLTWPYQLICATNLFLWLSVVCMVSVYSNRSLDYPSAEC